MDLLSDYYSFLEVNGKDEGLIFRELNTNEVYRQIEDGTWKESFINRFGTMLNEMPNLRSLTNRILHDGLLKKGFNIDPEKVYVNTFSSSTFVDGKGVYHREGSLKESYRLTDAALLNFFVDKYNDIWDVLGEYSEIGIYSVGKDGKFDSSEPLYGNGWGPNSQMCIAKEPADILYNSDLQALYTEEYSAFWGKYSDMYRDMLADLFLASAIRQYKGRVLSEYGFAMIRKVYSKHEGVTTYLFNVDKYNATDIIVMVGKVSGMDHTILYLPGASVPFIEFNNFTQMRDWLMEQLANPVAKMAFLKHFSIYVRQDGTSYSGVDTFINKMLDNVPGWNPQDYIMLEPTILPYNEVFTQVRNKTKAVMLDDADKEIKSNSEVYRDYMLNLFESLISHISVIDMLVPEIGIPLNAALSATTLGLSADIAVNGDSLEERKYGVGSLVGSTIFTVINLIPLITEVAAIYKTFTRVVDEIPAFADEEHFIMKLFGQENKEALEIIQPEDPPHLIDMADGEMLALVRLANDKKPLVVLRHVSGNMYVHLNPATLEEVQGEGLISEVLTETSGKRVFVSNSRLLGGAPYNPYENAFEEVWTSEILKRKADKLGLLDSKYTTIREKLGLMHASSNFDTKQQLAHELYYLLREYKFTYPRSLRLGVLKELGIQISEALYEYEVSFLGKALLGYTEKIDYRVSSKIYMTYISERLGELPEGTTQLMIKFSKEDPILAVSGLSESFIGDIPSELPFDVKYVMDNLSALDKLSKQYFRYSEYAGTGVKSNKEAFIYSLKESHRLGMISKWTLSEDENRAFIGYSYEELMRAITEYSCSNSTKYSIHPLYVKNMLMDLLPASTPNELMEMFGTEKYFKSLITKRLNGMEKIYQLSAIPLLRNFDNEVHSVFSDEFNNLTNVQDRLDMLMNNTNGIILPNKRQEIEYLNTYLDFFQSKGVTHIGLTDFFADIDQVELNEFLKDGTLTTNFGSTILSIDKGEVNGPFSQLIKSAQKKGLNIVALGESDATFHYETNPYTNIYVKGMINLNAERMLSGKKFIVLAPPSLINTTPGIREGLPGLAQQLKAPGIYFNTNERVINFMPDNIINRSAMNYTRLSYWIPFHPEPGRFLGWKKYDDGFTLPTPSQREAFVFSKIEQDVEGFKEEFRDIVNIASRYKCAQGLVCHDVTLRVRNALAAAGKRLGNGRSLTWWLKEGNDFVNNVHTAASVYIRDKEYVVDAAHLQFLHDSIDEGVMILPPEDWAEEIFNRVKGYNPYMVDRCMLGQGLYNLRLPHFTKPKVHKLPK